MNAHTNKAAMHASTAVLHLNPTGTYLVTHERVRARACQHAAYDVCRAHALCTLDL